MLQKSFVFKGFTLKSITSTSIFAHYNSLLAIVLPQWFIDTDSSRVELAARSPPLSGMSSAVFTLIYLCAGLDYAAVSMMRMLLPFYASKIMEGRFGTATLIG